MDAKQCVAFINHTQPGALAIQMDIQWRVQSSVKQTAMRNDDSQF